LFLDGRYVVGEEHQQRAEFRDQFDIQHTKFLALAEVLRRRAPC
jgi:hypothetical protein